MTKRILNTGFRSRTGILSLALCAAVLMTCVSVTFAWFGSTFENLNTVITMGDYSAEVAVFDADGKQLETKAADNGDKVSFENIRHMRGWSSGDVTAYYIHAANTGDIDIKTFLGLQSEFVSSDGGSFDENKNHFAFLVEDVSDKAASSNGVLNYIKSAKLPSAEYIYSNGMTFSDEGVVPSGEILSGERKTIALYICCYNLPDKYLGSKYSFLVNTRLITSQQGTPDPELAQKTEKEVSDVKTDAETADASEAEAETNSQVTETVIEKNYSTAPKHEFVWSDNPGEKTVTLVEYNGDKEDELIIPSLVDKKPVTKIGSGAFKTSKIEKLVIPATVKSLDFDALKCKTLTKFEIQAKTEVGEEIYTSPFKLSGDAVYTADMKTLVMYMPQSKEEAFKIPESVRVIFDKAFSGCENLKTISVKNVDCFGAETLNGSSITDIKLFGDKVVMASGEKVFGSQTTVTLHIPESMEEEYKKASSAEGYKLKTDLNKDDYAVKKEFTPIKSGGMKYLLLNDGDEFHEVSYETGINKFLILYDFYDIPDDGAVKIPEKVSVEGTEYKVAAIADNAFKNCGELKSVVLPSNSVIYTQKAFSGCDNLSEISFGK